MLKPFFDKIFVEYSSLPFRKNKRWGLTVSEKCEGERVAFIYINPRMTDKQKMTEIGRASCRERV